MKYRFRVSEQPPSHRPPSSAHRRVLRLQGRKTLRRCPRIENDPIRIEALFEIAALPEGAPKPKIPYKQKMRERMQRIRAWIGKAAQAVRRAAALAWEWLLRVLNAVAAKLRRQPRAKTIQSLPVLAGFLCATVLVSLLSAGGVLLGLFGGYHRAYTGVTVPDFVGHDASEIFQTENPYFNLIVEYETNPDVAAGLVISQSPRAGVTRRIYGKDGYCNVHLTVSRPEEPYLLEDLVGMRQRDALLTLQNHNLSATVTEIYSDTVPKGSVMETVPPSGSTLMSGTQVLLRVSAGTKQSVISVPNLFGMTETEANALLRKTGLTVGEVSYQSSTYAAGTIITQTVAAYSSVQDGAAVSYTVSIGERYWIPTVPDLYGMSLSQAEQALREQGLLIGTVHTIKGAAPHGTVITQAPLAGAPITSSTVSVDLYVIA